MVNEARIVAEFCRLVQIDSPSQEERKLADYLKEKLTELGVRVTEDQAGDTFGQNRPAKTGNLIGTLKGQVTGAPVLMLCAHMDTVEPGRGIKPVIRDGVIYSEGDTILGADDKAGIAAILEVLHILKEENLAHGDLEIVFTVAEEVGLNGSKSLDRDQLKAQMGFVLDCDGSAGTIITKAPSQYRITASIIGRAAHAGINPEEGINAISVASKAISQMTLGRIDEETTANIGIISGGKAINIIPDLVNIEGEARSINPQKLEIQAQGMISALELAAREAGAEARVRKELMYPRLSLEETDPGVRLAVKAAERIGLQPVLVSTGGGSDANILNGLGIPTVNLGIGMTKVHSSEEHITVENLALSAGYVLELVRQAAEEVR